MPRKHKHASYSSSSSEEYVKVKKAHKKKPPTEHMEHYPAQPHVKPKKIKKEATTEYEKEKRKLMSEALKGVYSKLKEMKK